MGLKEAGELMHGAEYPLYKEIKSGVSPSPYEVIFKTADQLKLTDHSFVLEIVFVKEGHVQLIQDKKDANLGFENNFFDSCFTVNTIYFWEDPISHFQEIYRVLRPGGSFSLVFKEKKFGENMPWTRADFTFYDINEVETFFRKSGFVNIEVKHISEDILDKGGKDMVTPFVSIAGSKEAG